MKLERELVEVDGGRLYCEAAGSGPPVVLIHGFALSTRMWGPQLPVLAERGRAIAYDARGFGRSSLPVDASPTHDADLEAVLAHFGVERPALIGASMGGMIASDYAARRPGATRALVLAGAFHGGVAWSDAFLAQWERYEELARNDVARAREAWLDSPLFGPARRDPDLARELAAIVDGYSGWHWQRGVRVAGARDALERLRALEAPALVMVGELDIEDFQRCADRLCEHIPHARRAVIRGAGHLPNLERPEEFNRGVIELLEAEGRP